MKWKSLFLFAFALLLLPAAGCSATKSSRQVVSITSPDDAPGPKAVYTFGRDERFMGQDLLLGDVWYVDENNKITPHQSAHSAGPGMGKTLAGGASFAAGMFLRTMGRPDGGGTNNFSGGNVGDINNMQWQRQRQWQWEWQQQAQAGAPNCD